MYCTLCNKSFGSEHALAQHNSAKYFSHHYFILSSPLIFLLLLSPSFHILFLFACIFPSILSLKFIFHGRHNYVCGSCGKRFKTDRSLQQHTNAVHPIKIIQRSFICDTCQLIFHNNDDLKQHTNRVHVYKPPPPTFTCRVCGAIFRSQYTFQQHQESCFECHVCGKRFSVGKYLAEHLDQMHTRKRYSPSSYCGICGATLPPESCLQSHQDECRLASVLARMVL